MEPLLAGILDSVIAAEVSILLGFLSYKYIEKFFLESRFLFTFFFITVAAFAICAACFIGVGVNRQEMEKIDTVPLPTKSVAKTRFEKACYQFADVPYLPVNVTDEMRRRAIKANRHLRTQQMPVLKDKYNLVDPFYEKHFRHTGTEMSFHDFYRANGSLNIVVFGNSYAHSGFHAVVNAFIENIKEIRLVSNAACQPFICRVFDPDNLQTFYDWSFHFNPYAQICLSRLYRDTLLEVLVDQRFDED
uniref:SGNH domain-containing protein n=1 Tax=Syphacia muris TaxID=451379 RepID=A0A0N5B1L8_9BILA